MVAFLARSQENRAIDDMLSADEVVNTAHRLIVDISTTLLDQAAGLAARTTQPHPLENFRRADASL